MPLYHLSVRTNSGLLPDPDGTDLPDAAAAREHATTVARELMRNAPVETHSWRMDVCDAAYQLAFKMVFAEVDEELARLRPPARESVIRGCVGSASLRDTINDLQRTMFQVQATIARSKRQPYLAAIEGVRL